VKWTNNDAVAHTTTSDGGTWNSGQLLAASGGGAYGGTSAGGSYQYTFNSAGTFTYHRANHPVHDGHDRGRALRQASAPAGDLLRRPDRGRFSLMAEGPQGALDGRSRAI
jgi:hypothetical protein